MTAAAGFGQERARLINRIADEGLGTAVGLGAAVVWRQCGFHQAMAYIESVVEDRAEALRMERTKKGSGVTLRRRAS